MSSHATLLRFRVQIITLCVSICLFVVPFISAAQVPNTPNLGLKLTPEFPEPYSDVEISVDDYTLITTGATITWHIDNIEQSAMRNKRTITVPVGALGEDTNVRVTLLRTGSAPMSTTRTITPAVVDIILEADTYVPNFYKGRPLPTAEAPLRAIAIVHSKDNKPASSYAYKWLENGKVMGGGSMIGQSVHSFTAPRFQNGYLTVEVIDDTGAYIARKSIAVERATPELHFYEENPLRGILKRSLVSPHKLIAEETTLYAEPYYLTSPRGTLAATFDWRLGNTQVSGNEQFPNTLTITREGERADAKVTVTAISDANTSIAGRSGDTLRVFFE